MGASSSEDLAKIEQAVRVLFRQARNPRFQDLVRERAGVDLDRAAYGVLIRVGELSPVRLSDLAASVGTDISTVSRQVRNLKAAGLVERQPDPDDGRAAHLALSPAGYLVGEQLRDAWVAIISDVLVDFESDEIEQFAGLVDRFAAALQVVD